MSDRDSYRSACLCHILNIQHKSTKTSTVRASRLIEMGVSLSSPRGGGITTQAPGGWHGQPQPHPGALGGARGQEARGDFAAPGDKGMLGFSRCGAVAAVGGGSLRLAVLTRQDTTNKKEGDVRCRQTPPHGCSAP